MKCRVCNTILTQRICHLPKMPLTDEFIPLKQNSDTEFIRDISIYQCNNCGLAQNPIDFDHESYYEAYEYSSGHSEFTREFMRAYANAACDAFRSIHGRPAQTVLEIGSGDGEQLKIFQQLGVSEVLGVEPSDALVTKSREMGVHTYKGLFSSGMIHKLPRQNFDICISSYTLDHVPNPTDYLRAAHDILAPGGILAFEVHDLAQIAKRGEWCLFEHEHTIYMDANTASKIASKNGFKVHAINPLQEKNVRANSLIVIAEKNDNASPQQNSSLINHTNLQKRIDSIINNLDTWIGALPTDERLVGYGAGGRGVMTLAALLNASRFEMLFDSNHPSNLYRTPKTRIPISGPDQLANYSDSWCLIFSFGYFDEITAHLEAAGYQRDKIVSLRKFLE